jgi:hypothetical protein
MDAPCEDAARQIGQFYPNFLQFVKSETDNAKMNAAFRQGSGGVRYFSYHKERKR